MVFYLLICFLVFFWFIWLDLSDKSLILEGDSWDKEKWISAVILSIFFPVLIIVLLKIWYENES